MEGLTREQAIVEFRKMWEWIAKEAKKRKRIVYKNDYFNENNIIGIPKCKCYLCEVTDNCIDCPVKWGSGYKCTDSESEFFEWLVANGDGDYRKASNMARKISRLKEKGV